MSTLTDITAAPPQALVSGVASAYRIGALVIFVSIIILVAGLWIDKNRKKAIGNRRNDIRILE
jgi:hypothetical protein